MAPIERQAYHESQKNYWDMYSVIKTAKDDVAEEKDAIILKTKQEKDAALKEKDAALKELKEKNAELTAKDAALADKDTALAAALAELKTLKQKP
jgi:predicted nuclease with TOPRIM domain